MGEVNHDYRFDFQLREGVVQETWCREMLAGGDRFEVKHDRVALITRRVYVEYADDPGARGIYKPSGLSTTEADCWLFVFGDPAIAFLGIATMRLRELARLAYRSEQLRAAQRYGSCPTRGVLVPLDWILPPE